MNKMLPFCMVLFVIGCQAGSSNQEACVKAVVNKLAADAFELESKAGYGGWFLYDDAQYSQGDIYSCTQMLLTSIEELAQGKEGYLATSKHCINWFEADLKQGKLQISDPSQDGVFHELAIEIVDNPLQMINNIPLLTKENPQVIEKANKFFQNIAYYNCRASSYGLLFSGIKQQKVARKKALTNYLLGKDNKKLDRFTEVDELFQSTPCFNQWDVQILKFKLKTPRSPAAEYLAEKTKGHKGSGDLAAMLKFETSISILFLTYLIQLGELEGEDFYQKLIKALSQTQKSKVMVAEAIEKINKQKASTFKAISEVNLVKRMVAEIEDNNNKWEKSFLHQIAQLAASSGKPQIMAHTNARILEKGQQQKNLSFVNISFGGANWINENVKANRQILEGEYGLFLSGTSFHYRFANDLPSVNKFSVDFYQSDSGSPVSLNGTILATLTAVGDTAVVKASSKLDFSKDIKVTDVDTYKKKFDDLDNNSSRKPDDSVVDSSGDSRDLSTIPGSLSKDEKIDFQRPVSSRSDPEQNEQDNANTDSQESITSEKSPNRTPRVYNSDFQSLSNKDLTAQNNAEVCR